MTPTETTEILRRWPDLERPELRAWDAADTLILDEAQPLIGAVGGQPGRVVVVDDNYGALTLGAVECGAVDVRVHVDGLVGELALEANAKTAGVTGFRALELGPELFAGATLVLMRLPRSLAALDEFAALVAAHAAPDVVVIAGGRIKHMSLRMNEVLGRHFDRVDVSHARQKSRLLLARQPRPGAPVEPRRELHDDLGLWVVATGGVFADAAVDQGTRALIEVLGKLPPFTSAIDLGCGTGLLAAAVARAHPHAQVLATDQSASAIASTRMTLEANGIRGVRVTRDDAMSAEPDDSADLILLNPPFHSGATVHAGLAAKLFRASARVLRPGGELWTVWNSHLAHRPELERLIGSTSQVARTSKFTVTRSRRRQP